MNSPSLFSQQQYSDTGFMIISVAEEAACSFPVATFGFPINKCTVMDTYSYMVRLTQGIFHDCIFSTMLLMRSILSIFLTDSCAGGLIEYYADPACNTTTLLGTSSITESDLSCQAVDRPIFGGTFSSVACTTASEPRLIYDSAVTK